MLHSLSFATLAAIAAANPFETTRAEYVARCARWSPLMEDVRPLVEAERAAYGSRVKSHIRKASAKLSAARRHNLETMASSLYPGVKFSAKKWEGWGGSYELTWTDGPTEEHLQEAGDFDLLERSRYTFDGWDDSSDVVFAEFADFADKFFDIGGQIRFRRKVSDEFRQSIANRIRAAVPGLPEDDRARVSDDRLQRAICSLYRDVEDLSSGYLCDNLVRGGLGYAVAYIARCIDAAPAQDEPTDPTPDNGGTGAAYGDAEKSQHQEAPEGLTLADIPGGVAVVGDSRTTYRHRRDIKARGARWNREAQQWEATDPEAIANLREWLAAPESSPAPADAAPSAMAAHQRAKGLLPANRRDALNLYRMGDTYAAIFADASDVATACPSLKEERTSVGFPVVRWGRWQLDQILPRIVRAGHSVAIYDTPADLLPFLQQMPALPGMNPDAAPAEELTPAHRGRV